MVPPALVLDLPHWKLVGLRMYPLLVMVYHHVELLIDHSLYLRLGYNSSSSQAQECIHLRHLPQWTFLKKWWMLAMWASYEHSRGLSVILQWPSIPAVVHTDQWLSCFVVPLNPSIGSIMWSLCLFRCWSSFSVNYSMLRCKHWNCHIQTVKFWLLKQHASSCVLLASWWHSKLAF